MTEIRDYNGRPSIWIDGKPYTSPIAFIRTREKVDGKMQIFFDKNYFKALGEAGIKVYYISCNTTWVQSDSLEVFDAEVKMLLDAVPDAYIIARISLHPPKEWIEANPDECVLYSDGTSPEVELWTESYQTRMPHMYSLCSQKWREDAGDAMVKTWLKILERPYADRIIACFPTAGGTSEWYYITRFLKGSAHLGHSKAFRQEFSLYLREKYGTEEELRRVWKDSEATFDNPKLPEQEMLYYINKVDEDTLVPREKIRANDPVPEAYRNGTNVGSFTDLDACPQVYDFINAFSYGTARSQTYFAKRIKEVTPGHLVGFCYGAQDCISFFEGRTVGIRMILECKDIDFIENPSTYENRRSGGFVGQRVVEDSFSLYNKIYVCQDDVRTMAENRYFQKHYRIWDMTDTLNVLKREFGKIICCDMHIWWFDQLLGGKRFKYPEVYELFAKQRDIAAEAWSLDRRKKSDVAFIFDENSMLGVSQQTSNDLVRMLRNYQMARCGFSYDQYYHTDMSNPNMPSYKMYVFVNTLFLTKSEREVILTKLRQDNAVAVFMYGSGFADPMADKKMSPSNISKLTGFNMAMINDNYSPMFRWNGEKHPISEGFDRRKPQGVMDERRLDGHIPTISNVDAYLYPLFYPDDPDAITLASFLDSGHPAISIKYCGDFTSVYYGGKSISHETLRAIAAFAGANIFCDSGDVCYVGRNYITFHASSSGKKTLYLPVPCEVREVYEDKCYGENVTEFSFDAYFGETKMFRIIENIPPKKD